MKRRAQSKYRRALAAIAALSSRCGLREPRRRHLGADRRPHRQEERQRRERVEVLGARGFEQVPVEHDIGGGPEPALGQVHQQEGEIVEHVARRDQRAELDRVEQHRPAVDQHDVAEMEIAVDAADEPAPPALDQQRMNAPVGGAARARERIDVGGRKQLGRLAEGRDMLLDIVRERLDPGRRRRPRRRRHAPPPRRGRAHPPAPASIAPASASRSSVASSREAAHLHRPLDRRAVAVEREPPVRLARDRHDPAVDVGRERPVDLELGLAGRLALVEGRIVEKREAHRALDLPGAVAGQEHRRRMGVDALDRRPAMGRRLGEQREHRLLGFSRIIHYDFAATIAHPWRTACSSIIGPTASSPA